MVHAWFRLHSWLLVIRMCVSSTLGDSTGGTVLLPLFTYLLDFGSFLNAEKAFSPFRIRGISFWDLFYVSQNSMNQFKQVCHTCSHNDGTLYLSTELINPRTL